MTAHFLTRIELPCPFCKLAESEIEEENEKDVELLQLHLKDAHGLFP